MTCEWCGCEHAQIALCAARPKWTRRGFLALGGIGIASTFISGLGVARWFAHQTENGTITIYGRSLRESHEVLRPLYSWPVAVQKGLNSYNVVADVTAITNEHEVEASEARLEIAAHGSIKRLIALMSPVTVLPHPGNTLTLQWPVTVTLA